MAATRNRQSPDPVSRLRRTLLTRLGEWLGPDSLRGRSIAVGFSGGRDSVALLHALAALRADTGIRPRALHVHHGLSLYADHWVAFAENFCKALAVPLAVERVTVARDLGSGIEAAARVARYHVFAASGADLILLAHHQDDQAETLLFNLLRGTGVHGAAAMPRLRRLARPTGDELLLGRPWLEVSRVDIDAYSTACGLDNIEDESNLDQTFSRNHLRHEILPRLTERYPKASSTLGAAARRFGDAAVLLDALAEIDLAAVAAGDRLDWSALSRLDEARQKNLLYHWLAVIGQSVVSEARLVEFIRQCRDASDDALIAASFGDVCLRRWQGGVYRLMPANAPVSPGQVWFGEPVLAWCGGQLQLREGVGAGIRADRLGGEVKILPRQGGEMIRFRSDGPGRPVRLLFQERGVPPWERQRMPFLWVDGQLAAVGGIGIAADFQAAENQPSIGFDWRPCS